MCRHGTWALCSDRVHSLVCGCVVCTQGTGIVLRQCSGTGHGHGAQALVTVLRHGPQTWCLNRMHGCCKQTWCLGTVCGHGAQEQLLRHGACP